MSKYLNSANPAARLGVSRQKLYAYVSPGLSGEAGNTQLESRNFAPDVDRLAGDRARSLEPTEVAKVALNWGPPVLDSGIPLIAGGQFQDGTRILRGS